ncbi:MAG: GerMN domain-containing protein [Firmicutes bacterium]|nr:GerMN domain-containing protein [Bacillota bacterium]
MLRLSKSGVWIISLAVLLIGLGWAILDGLRLRRENHRLSMELRQDQVEAAVFFIKSTPTNFYLKPVIVKIGRDGDKHLKVMEALFAGPPADSDLSPVFPPETKVLDIKLQNGLATVNLNRAATRLNVGAQGEALAVAALVNTLTKMPDVYRVKIRIEGKEVDSLAGHVDLTATFEYDNQVVALE